MHSDVMKRKKWVNVFQKECFLIVCVCVCVVLSYFTSANCNYQRWPGLLSFDSLQKFLYCRAESV